MGLGPLALYGLAEARAKALDARQLRHQGIDPIDARRAPKAQGLFTEAKAILRAMAPRLVSRLTAPAGVT